MGRPPESRTRSRDPGKLALQSGTYLGSQHDLRSLYSQQLVERGRHLTVDWLVLVAFWGFAVSSTLLLDHSWHDCLPY